MIRYLLTNTFLEGRQFHERPIRVLFAERFCDQLVASLDNDKDRDLCTRLQIGTINVWTNNTMLLEASGQF
jgi:hypothetical protein